MPYNTNPALVDARADLVKDLREGRAAAWIVSSGDRMDARRLADKIRETLYIARLYPDRFPELARASEQYQISIVSGSRVEAIPKRTTRFESTSPRVAETTPLRDRGIEASIMGGEPQGRTVPTVGLTTATQVIASWHERQPSNDPLYFAETRLDYNELVSLYMWAMNRKPKLMILTTDDTLTLSLWEDDVGAFAWKPVEAPSPVETFDL